MSKSNKLEAKQPDATLVGISQKPYDKDDLTSQILRQDPPAEVVRAWQKSNYISIGELEEIARDLFAEVLIDDVEITLMGNAVVCKAILFVRAKEGWTKKLVGVGASPLQMNAGAKGIDISQVKQNAFQLAVPIAKTLAVKNAFKDLGRYFGSMLNREKEGKRIPNYTDINRGMNNFNWRLNAISMAKTQDGLKQALLNITSEQIKNPHIKKQIDACIVRIKENEKIAKMIEGIGKEDLLLQSNAEIDNDTLSN